MVVVKANKKAFITDILLLFAFLAILLYGLVNDLNQQYYGRIGIAAFVVIALLFVLIRDSYNYICIKDNQLVIRRMKHGTIELSKDEIRGYIKGSARKTTYVEIYYNDVCYKIPQMGTENYDALLIYLEENCKELAPVERLGG